MDSPRREIFNGGLGIVVVHLVCWQIFFCRLILGVQSSRNIVMFLAIHVRRINSSLSKLGCPYLSRVIAFVVDITPQY